ncbi:MAG: DUF4365 domain-containing protein [Enterocloster citroniae]|nr:DUF4365 domain-containing protein [Enterocloster citroniae]
MRTKIRHKNHIIESNSLNIIKNIMPSEWVIRKLELDYGIDLDIEIFEKNQSGYYETLGEHVLVQVKGKEKIEEMDYRQLKQADTTFVRCIKYQIETSELLTVQRMGAAVPVLLFLVDIDENIIYFVCLNDYIDFVILNNEPDYIKKKSKTIYIPESNQINNAQNLDIIKWYSKRGKLYSLFNRISYIYDRLNFADSANLYEKWSCKYIKEILKYDIWCRRGIWPLLDYTYDKMIEFQKKIDLGELVTDDGERKCHFNEYPELLTETHAKRLMLINNIWHDLTSLSLIYEDTARLFWIPDGILNLNVKMQEKH